MFRKHGFLSPSARSFYSGSTASFDVVVVVLVYVFMKMYFLLRRRGLSTFCVKTKACVL